MYIARYSYKMSGTVRKKWEGNILDKIIVEDTPYVIHRINFEGISWYDIYRNGKLITSINTIKSSVAYVEHLLGEKLYVDNGE